MHAHPVVRVKVPGPDRHHEDRRRGYCYACGLMRWTEQLAGSDRSGETDPRDPECFARFHARARAREPDIVYDVLRVLSAPVVLGYLRTRVVGRLRPPASGPVILAPNHGSFCDHFILAASAGRRLQFMAKSQMFQPPGQWAWTHAGVFPIRRGLKDEAALATAAAILARSGTLTMYCEGTRARDGRRPPGPKPGIGRLALESGATVVPVGVFGSDRIANWRRERPLIRVAYGEPMRWEQDSRPEPAQQRAVAEAIYEQIQLLYARLDPCGDPPTVRRNGAGRDV
jgi:1-acyl-sn-glycerol-3-phosphate acyltransferase